MLNDRETDYSLDFSSPSKCLIVASPVSQQFLLASHLFCMHLITFLIFDIYSIFHDCIFFCLFLSNVKQLSELVNSGLVDTTVMPHFNYSDPRSVALEEYRDWFKTHGNTIKANITDCNLEQEMQKVKT